jgi:hypothetical protein
MATFIDPVEASNMEVLRDISYFEGYDVPMSPPETPPMKQDASMILRERTPIRSHLEYAFPRTPLGSPSKGLKRTWSNNIKEGFANDLPLTPPSTPPTRYGIHPIMGRTMSGSINKGHQISIVSRIPPVKPQILTIL